MGTTLKSKLAKVFARWQFSLGKMAFEAASGSLGDLLFGQRAEYASRRPALGVSALGESRPRRLEGGQAQFGEHEIELCDIHGAHERSPDSAVETADVGAVSRTS